MHKFLSLIAACGIMVSLSACHYVKHYNESVCYIERPEGVITAISHQGFVALPRTSLEAGELARNAIKEATLIDTGLHVEVGEVIYDDKRNLHLYFNCTPIHPLKRVHYEDMLPARGSKNFDVSVINPHDMTNWKGEKVELPWSFPKDILVMKRHYSPGSKVKTSRPEGVE